MIRRPPRSTPLYSSAASDVYKRQIVDPARVLGNLLTDASPDMMRHLLQTMINALLSADADAVVGAQWGQPSAGRTTQRNGYRHRPLDTRAGTIDVAVPKLRSGTYFPE